MKSYPEVEEVLEDLGEKVIDACLAAIAKARDDLEDYRLIRPEYVASSSARGLANWIHDRIWTHLAAALEDIGEARVFELGATREVFIEGTALTYRIRAKRHHISGLVRTYPTQGALEFLDQPTQLTFEGLGLAHLIVGYQWEPDAYAVGPAVLSLRDGLDNVIWLTELEQPVPASSAKQFGSTRSGDRPRIELKGDDSAAPAAGEP